MLEMTMRDYIPAVSAYVSKLAEGVANKKAAVPGIASFTECDLIEKLSGLLDKTYSAYSELYRVENIAVKKTTDEDAAFYYKTNVIPKMDALRKVVDEMEVLTAREYWPVPTYGDITFRV